ncbi:LysR family transcriptional regulator [Bacillus velezensis]|uniref:LysR family transcriptional regulator n=1 Tax=Bacillus velezensis TaxID=492670 RepID=UPI000B4CDD2B|nr:LysR family transcriptional regulator [Bacillus velezensis]OWP59073.1 LysR family transcriptional regulator [Bacillus velezensis]QEQ05203.1 LysR family transcriptional regulator [Bacillus velezensis]WEY81514.1 LysR family transcriptional regulator [Bacillus velezensis]
MYYGELKTFIAVVEEKNFTKAAQKLMISQPSVSLHIKNLEKEFQTALLNRSPKHFTTTPTGDILYQRAKQMVFLYEQAKSEIYAHHHYVKGKLKIAASFTIGEYILPPLLAKLHNEYPELNLDVMIGNTEEVSEAVRMLQADIGLIEGHTGKNELDIQPFMEDELCIAAPNGHPLAGRKNILAAELQNQAWVTREKGSGTREYLDHVLQSNGLRPKSMMTISSNQGVKEAVISGMGLSVLSKSVLQKDLLHGSISVLEIKGFSLKRKLSIIQSSIMENTKNKEIFIALLKSQFQSSQAE